MSICRYGREVDIVALTALRGSVEEEAPRLAADLGTTPYDTALLLRSPAPVPLLRTDDRARALALLARLRERGHEAVACDASAIVSADAMVQLRAFRLEVDALVVTSTSAEPERVAWADVVALVRAMHRTRTRARREERRAEVLPGARGDVRRRPHDEDRHELDEAHERGARAGALRVPARGRAAPRHAVTRSLRWSRPGAPALADRELRHARAPFARARAGRRVRRAAARSRVRGSTACARAQRRGRSPPPRRTGSISSRT